MIVSPTEMALAHLIASFGLAIWLKYQFLPIGKRMWAKMRQYKAEEV